MTHPAHRCRVEPERRLGTITLVGRVEGDDLAGSIRALYGHPGWEPGFDVLWNCTEAWLALSPDGLELVEDAYRRSAQHFGPGRVAVVAPGETSATIARLLIHRFRRPDRERRVFDSMATALGWLDAA